MNYIFRTQVDVSPHKLQYGVGTKLFSIGSCFADSVVSRLRERQVEVYSNPYGVVYNPDSISKQIMRVVGAEEIKDGEIVNIKSSYSSFMAHGSINAPSEKLLKEKLRAIAAESYEKLISANIVLITYGTSWVYEHVERGIIVANCHKVDGRMFNRRVLTLEELRRSIQQTILSIRKVNSGATVIFTVLPIRHMSDGVHGNQYSKSLLHVALEEEIVQNEGNVSYFPSYEIVLDDLRDYRFYSSDMLHPSEVAVDYVFLKFSEVYFTEEMRRYMQDGEKLSKILNHRPMGGEEAEVEHKRLVDDRLGEFRKRWGDLC